MSTNAQMLRELSELDAKLRVVLPAEYQAHYEDVQPVSMGSAGLQFDGEGRVAWDRIWGSFCDLAMAGGPPHKGKLLEPGDAGAIAAEPERYAQVVKELRRGIGMVTGLRTEESPNAGWVRVVCPTGVMAGWLGRAIVMENVWAHVEGCWLELPAGPGFRLEKEIKNVVTSIAKTHHYFDGHMEARQREQIAELFAGELLQPCRTGEGSWRGVECPSVRSAIWMMRALVVENVMARREDETLFVPSYPEMDPRGDRVEGAVRRVTELAKFKGLFSTGLAAGA